MTGCDVPRISIERLNEDFPVRYPCFGSGRQSCRRVCTAVQYRSAHCIYEGSLLRRDSLFQGCGHAHTACLHGKDDDGARRFPPDPERSEEHTSELQSLMRTSYAVFCLKKQKDTIKHKEHTNP